MEKNNIFSSNYYKKFKENILIIFKSLFLNVNKFVCLSPKKSTISRIQWTFQWERSNNFLSNVIL